MSGEVVPFGKYSGKSLEVMVQDRQYVEWLIKQPWFRQEFKRMYQYIIANIQDPGQTPVHNSIQALFLDINICYRLLYAVAPEVIEAKRLNNTAHICVNFECYGWDVEIAFADSPYQGRFLVEIKPTVADEYPVVLRQMKKNLPSNSPHLNNGILLLHEYKGTGVTREQFVEIFNRAGMHVVFLSELNA